MSDNRRDQLIDFIEKEFIGPDPIDWKDMCQSNGEEILKSDPPGARYIAGILFPKETLNSEVSSEEVDNNLDDEIVEDSGEDTIKKSGSAIDFLEDSEELINRSNAYRQSAMSITVAVKNNDEICVEASAGTYRSVTENKKITYPRTPVSWNNNGAAIELPSKFKRVISIPVDNIGLQFDITYRYKLDECVIYTFTLENTRVKAGTSAKDEECFFQVKFKLFSKKGFSPLVDGQKITEDDDYRTNLLLYRNVHNYAIGHGCGADWEESDVVKWVSTSVFPKHDIKPIVPSVIDGVSLEMIKMSPYGDFQKAVEELKLMCEKYREWINGLKVVQKTLSKEYTGTADRHINNCETCLSRMEKGIELLERDESVRTAFQYMNLAMLMQQLHFNLPLQKWTEAPNNDIKLDDPVKMPVVTDPDTWYGNKERYGKWRPFQLAFVLMNLRSMYNRDCNERSIVDLIWFPTGGGKTEAYLGLSAYTIFIRRIKNKEDSGTAILMRYTLRLLTAQQYERASTLICACDLIRRNNEAIFGKNRISIGLWVGSSTTPNSEQEAVKKYNALYKSGGDNPFVILKCPWCGAQMGPVAKKEKKDGKNRRWELPGYEKIPGKHASFSFEFKCRNKCCDFSQESLPLYVVDETIYDKTPTLLLGTVDKFAMLPFKPKAQSLFGYKNGVKITSPDLIIQDELHLISGPLGSMVGHYETLINELCTIRTSSGEIHPKIIASTATISRAKEQCHALYGCKKEDVFQFPPAGLDAGNSFFAKEDRKQNGRRYVGILATGAFSDTTAAIRLYAALLYGAKAMDVEKEQDRDPYWTNVGYYNSIRELGQASTWIRADIAHYLDIMYKRRYDDKRYHSKDEYRENRRYIWRDEELTSRIKGSEVASSLANLNITYPGEKIDGIIKEHPIDVCLATNMISVGLDVPRLGLMTVAGQPKTTSEYIQATSRVGRNAKDAPGLVFVLYRPSRPRDKSHYEHFKSYHSRVYCNVEPTSVTPFSAPVRERALHAIMIGMMRLEEDKSFNEDPPSFPDFKLRDKIKTIIENRVDDVDNEEMEATIDEMTYILQCWEDWSPSKWEPGKDINFAYTDQVPLMYAAGSPPNDAWDGRGMETPTSMRNVDSSCEAKVLAHRYTSEED